jgi:hypothetical protein
MCAPADRAARIPANAALWGLLLRSFFGDTIPEGPQRRVGMRRAPRVAFQSGKVRFFDATGRAWSVYDVRRLNGRIRKTAIAAEVATWRVFVAPDGKKHAYRFPGGEPRELEPTRLAQQLNGALWAGTYRPNRRSRR